MKSKHIAIRVEQCLALAKASNCVETKVGALLVDPVRNVVLMDGYNGGPRKGTKLCKEFCARKGLEEGDFECRKHSKASGLFELVVKGTYPLIPTDGGSSEFAPIDQVLAYKAELLKTHAPIEPGTRMEVGCHHAETNVIANAAANGVKTSGAWLFITMVPCLMCAKLLHHAGISKVVVIEAEFRPGDAGISYLEEHMVKVQFVDPKTFLPLDDGP